MPPPPTLIIDNQVHMKVPEMERQETEITGPERPAAGTGNMALLATSDYNERRAIIQKYGYSSQFAIWFIEEHFFHHWTLNGWGNVFRINMDRRKALKDAANKALLQV